MHAGKKHVNDTVAYHEQKDQKICLESIHLICGVSTRLCSDFFRSTPSEWTLPGMHVSREPLSFSSDACVLKGSDTEAVAPISISLNKYISDTQKVHMSDQVLNNTASPVDRALGCCKHIVIKKNERKK